jgi:hypothetical protein
MKHVLTLALGCVLVVGAASASESVYVLDEDSAIASGAVCGQSQYWPQNYGKYYATCQRNGSVPSTGSILRLRTPGSLDPTGGGTAGTSGTVWRAYARWTTGNNRCANVRIEVRRNNGATFVASTIRDFRTEVNSHNWIPIATFTAVPGQNYEVTYYANEAIGAAGTGIGCYMTPDGAMFVKESFDGTDIENSSLFDTDIGDEPGLDWAEAGEINLSSVGYCDNPSWTNLTSVTLTAPTSGYVLVEATGIASNTVASGQYSRVGIDDSSTGKSIDSYAPIFENVSDETASYENERRYAIRNVYSVGAGSHTYYLKGCKSEFAGGRILWGDFTGIFFPTRY